MRCLDRRRRGERPPEIDAFRCRHELDCDDGGEIGVHPEKPPRAVGRHAHMVFLIGRGRCAVDACRMRKLLVLAHEGGGGALRNHEARIEPGIAHEERRQERDRGIDQRRYSPFAD